jgi:uncharacterized protein YqeY
MSLLLKLQEDMKIAMKAGEKDRLSVIRMILSDVKNIDLNPAKPTEQQVVEAYAKKLRKSLEEYEKIGKTDQVTALKFEIGIAEAYLPKKLCQEETQKLVDEFLSGKPFTAAQAGQATGAFMKAHGAGINGVAVDAAIASQLIRAKLST